MGLWSVIMPAAGTNLVTNPSLETATTDWTASGYGASIAQLSTYQKYGLYSLAVTPGAGTDNGVYYGTVSLTSGTTYTASCWVKGANGIPYKIWFANTSGTLKGTATTFTGTGAWQRVEVSWACDATTTYRVYITKNNSADTTLIYCDGLQVEAASAATTYMDGTLDGCEWSGTPHASTATRDGESRKGGAIINLSTYDVNVLAEMGVGAPAGRHNVQEQAFLDGGKFQGRKVLPRTIDIICQLKGTNYAGLYSLRKDLWDVIKPDRVEGDQAFILRYTGANSGVAVDIQAVYDSGLEMGNPEMYLEEFTLRCIAYDPWWREQGNEAKALGTSQNVASSDYLLAKIDGVWGLVGTSVNGEVYAFAKGPNGEIYVGGAFTTAGGTTVNRIAKWHGGAWSAMGETPGANGDVRAIVVAANGDVYIGGSFTTAGGTTVNRVAKWNGSAWSALGVTGVSATVYALAFDSQGNLYAGGEFSTAAGTTVNNVAKWNGTAWSALGGTPGTNDWVYGLAVDLNDDLWVGGEFTQAGGAAAKAVAVWNGSAWSEPGGGFTGGVWVYDMLMSPNGVIYAVGDSPCLASKWTGNAWKQIGATATGVPLCIDYGSETGQIIVAGDFSDMGGNSAADVVALWNGYTWTHLPVILPGTVGTYDINDVLIDGDDIYIGSDDTGTTVTAVTTSVTNSGTRTAYPVIKIKRAVGTSAVVEYLENVTTGKKLYFNYALLDGETLTIDLRPEKRTIESSFFGTAWRALLRGSDFSEFCLLPGSNTISVFVNPTGAPTVTAWMEWETTHWGAEGAAA